MPDKARNAEIIAVGTELLLGSTTNTDAQEISEMLSALGINVYYHTVVGDNAQRLSSAIRIAKSRADIIITTGGLGPTCDDLTKQVLAESFGRELYFDEEEAESIRRYFSERLHGAEMTENNLRQAMLPKGCSIFRNEWGTAPGCAFEAQGKHVLMLPGPPRECREMFKKCAVPYLRALSDSEIISRSIKVFGEGESSIESRLRDMMNELTNPTLAPYAKEGEVMLRVTAKAGSREKAEEMIVPVVEKVRSILGDMVYGIDVDSLESAVLGLLKERNMTICAAESCTGGLMAKRLTDLTGASEIFAGGVVSYSAQSKTRLLGIDPKTIEAHGVVSSQVAAEMAERARALLGADIGIGITGMAGPGTDGVMDVGSVFIAMASKEGCFVRRLHLGSGRHQVRTAAVNHGLDMVRRHLTGLDVISRWGSS